jgi:hypothetical protein
MRQVGSRAGIVSALLWPAAPSSQGAPVLLCFFFPGGVLDALNRSNHLS